MSEPPPSRPTGPPMKPTGPGSGPPPAGPPGWPPPSPAGGPHPGGPPPGWPPPGVPGWQDEWDELAAARNRRRRWVLGLVGVLAIAGLLAGMLISVTGDDEDGEGGQAAQPGGPAPTTTAPSGPVDEDELRQTIDEISSFVEQERGLEFEEQVDVELASGDEFEARLLEDFEEDAEELRQTDVLMTAFGLIDPDVDLVEAMRTLLGAGVVGFYDPETGELVVRGTSLSPYVRSTIAHELVHALDDQHFELDRPAYEDADDEVGFGFSAVAEGNARRIENAYMETLTADERAAADAEAMDLALEAGPGILSVPGALIDLIEAPYSDGEQLVDALLDDGGQQGLDRAFDEPPRTSEQVLEPEAYLDGDDRSAVPHPEPAGEVVDEGVAGQLLIGLVLAGVGQDGASEGWGGDWAVAWQDGDRSCVTMTVVGDTADDTEQLRGAFGQWAEAQDDATVSGGSGGSGPVTVEACAG